MAARPLGLFWGSGAAAIAHFSGWRTALYLMTGLSVLLTVFIAFYLPRVRAPAGGSPHLPTVRSRSAMRIFLVVVAVNVVFFFAHNLLYTYVSPLLLQHGLPESMLSVALLVTGGVSIFGLWGAGQMVDRWPAAGLFGGGLAMLLGMGLVYGHLLSAWAAVGAVGVWCAGYAAVIPFVMSGAIRARATSADVAGAAINSASNFGILLGSAVGDICSARLVLLSYARQPLPLHWREFCWLSSIRELFRAGLITLMRRPTPDDMKSHMGDGYGAIALCAHTLISICKEGDAVCVPFFMEAAVSANHPQEHKRA